MSGNYDEAYRTANWFGTEPSPLLVRYGEVFEAGDRVLDVGVGQGRNALPLARRGVLVTGIDPSAVAVATMATAAADEGLPLETSQVGYAEYEPANAFDAVLCCGLMQILPVPEIALLTRKLEQWVRPGGLLFLTAWHTDDPACRQPPAGWTATGPRSFATGTGDRFFLYPDEIIGLFPAWKVVHHAEGRGEIHRHGAGPREQHGEVDVVLARPEGKTVDVATVLYG